MMKKLLSFLLSAACAAAIVSCADTSSGGCRVAALDDAVWEMSEWISAADAPVKTGSIYKDWRAAEGASWFVSVIENENKVVSAVWMTAGLGVYDIYVNGRIVGEEVLKPGFTHWQKTKLSYTYDVTDIMDTASGAENIFSAQVNPGWWADKIVTPADYDGFVGKKCAFRGVLQLTFADGSVKYFGTDTENWKAGVAGRVKRAAIFDGEFYDAREEDGHNCPDKLSTPEENTEFKGEIYPSEGAEVYHRHDLAMKPVKAYIWNGVEGESDEEYGKVLICKDFKTGKDLFVRPGETLVVDFGQNAAAVPAFVFKAKENMIRRLRQNFKEHDDCLQTGFLGTSILMGTLTENGMSDIAYTLLFQRKNPSWLYSIDNGATTIWERWNSYTLENGMGPKGMNSFNHYAYGCVCEWLWETAAGIASDPSDPGFRHIIMKPVPDRRLGYVEAEYKSAAGLIKSAWRYEGDRWIWEFTIPEGSVATVTLPGQTDSRQYISGTYTIEQ